MESSSQAEVRHDERWLRDTLRAMGNAVIAIDSLREVVFVNRRAETLTGYSQEEATGKPFSEILRPNNSQLIEVLDWVLGLADPKGTAAGFETGLIGRNGGRVAIEGEIAAIRDEEGRVTGAVIVFHDVTERRHSEVKHRQAERLESLGLLAGGVAHDFNNLLTGIMGNCSLALETLPATSPERMMLLEAVKASKRAAELTQQLLAYAGKGQVSTRPTNLATLAQEISSLIKASISKKVELEFDLETKIPAVDVDPGQIQQVIMNLVINGAEALGSATGKVMVRTGWGVFSAEHLRSSHSGDGKPGRYTFLAVQDNGSGMDELTAAKIFDPFFTTKFQGRGLGLASVLGIVRRHGGVLQVETRPAEGTTFTVLFPALDGFAPIEAAPVEADELQGAGTVLIVDDEDFVRSTVKACLERYGYGVLLAEDGKAGVDLFRERQEEISLVLLDLAMPVMDGAEALRHMHAIRPETPVILTSGYTQHEAARLFSASGVLQFLQKPYQARQLVEALETALRRSKP